METQLTTLERRMDRALELRSNGTRRLLHLEVVVDPEADFPPRMFEYASLLIIAQRTAPDQSQGAAKKGEGAAKEFPPIKSVALLLCGRAKPWPPFGELRTSWPEPEPFSGHRYQIEAVYQRTVDQLLSRPGVFWLVFGPLAVDAMPEAMWRVLEEIRHREPLPEERAELYVAMLVLAALDTWGHNLRQEIKAMMQRLDRETIREAIRTNETFREWFEEGRKKGIEEMLHNLFIRRIHRELTPAEKEALSSRAAILDAEQATAVVDLPADALMAWLRAPDAE
jgi:hypothetical protein